MREIKFRAFDGVQKEFQYLFLERGGVRFKFQNRTPNPQDVCEWQEFTGLHDKNGKEIYEEDIVKSTPPNIDFHSKPVLVKWSEITAGWLFGKTSLPHTDLEFVEIIGNRFENIELLK